MPRANITVTDIKGVVYKGRREEMDPDKERFAHRDARAHARRGDRGRRHLPRPFGRRRAQARDGEEDGRAAADPRARQPRARDPGRSGARRRGPTASSPPGARTIRTRSTTSCASRSSSAARSTSARPPSTTRWRSRRCARSPSSRRPRPRSRWRSRTAIESISFGPEYIIPRPFDPRLIAARRARGRARRRWTRAWRRGRSRISTAYRESLSQFVYQSGLIMKPLFSRGEGGAARAWCTPRARTSACCARRRSWWTKAWRGRS